MPGVRAEVYNAAGDTIQGHLPNVLSATYSLELERIGSFTCTIPAGDSLSSVATKGRQLWLYREDEGLVFKGRIDQDTTEVDQAGNAGLVLGGPSIAANLRDANTLAGKSFSDSSLSSTVSSLLTGTGWSSGTLDSPSTNFSGRFDYVSVWKSLQVVAETFGLLLREDNPNEEIDISAFNTASGIRLISPEAVSPNLRDNTNAIPITGIRKNASSFDVVNKVIPIGQRTGINAANFDLEDSDRTSPYTIQNDTGPDSETYYYIEDSTSQSSYGTRTRAVQIKDVQPEGLASADFTRAANALYDRAVTYLERHKDPLESYDVQFAGLKHYDSGSPTVQPGETMYVGFRGMTEDANGKRVWLDVDDDLYVMAMTRTFNPNGSDTWRMTLSTVPRHVPTDGNITADLIEEIHALEAAPLPFVLFGDGILRVDQYGIQMKSDTLSSPTRQIWLLSDLSDDPTALDKTSRFGGNYSGFTSGIEVVRENTGSNAYKAWGNWESVDDTINDGHIQAIAELGSYSDGGNGSYYARFRCMANETGPHVQFSLDNGSTWTEVSGGMSTIVKTSDESVTSSTTLQDDDELTYSADANAEYEVLFYLYETEASGDFKFDISVPAGASGYYRVEQWSGTSLAAAKTEAIGTTTALTAGGAQNFIVIRSGVVVAGTSGSVTLQWAQNTSNGTASTVKAGSYLLHRKA